MTRHPIGLYVHVPFCTALCPYCDFAVVVGRNELHQRYADALVTEAAAASNGDDVQTVFIGGGTPTVMDAGVLARALEGIGEAFAILPDAEATLEANPETVDERALGMLRAAGLNRVSIGAQSFSDDVLRALGRTHSAADIGPAVRAARAAGFNNVSLDLIYGGPGETDADWEASLRASIGLEPDHVSCYALTIEPRTRFGTAVARGSMDEPSQDVLARRYERALEMLAAAGYRQYELSNWARPGAECRHNFVYWTQGDYVGLGLGAHSHRDGHRWWNTRALATYLAQPGAARAGEEHLDAVARAEEWVSLRVRLIEGVDIEEMTARLGRDVGPVVATLEAAGLVTRAGSMLRLTPRGMLLENEVTVRLVAA